eukprot:1349195-Pyramimonas_sp.AAC.1
MTGSTFFLGSGGASPIILYMRTALETMSPRNLVVDVAYLSRPLWFSARVPATFMSQAPQYANKSAH